MSGTTTTSYNTTMTYRPTGIMYDAPNNLVYFTDGKRTLPRCTHQCFFPACQQQPLSRPLAASCASAPGTPAAHVFFRPAHAEYNVLRSVTPPARCTAPTCASLGCSC